VSTSEWQTSLQSHINELCSADRAPGSKGYFRAQEYLEDQIAQLGFTPQRHEFWDRPAGLCRNIYAESSVSNAPHILIGAHYDGLARSGPAADDNASAVAVVLELMKALQSKANFTFTFFDVEENYGWGALHGSKQFAKFYNRPLSAVIILDLVGGALIPLMESTYFQFGPALPQLQSEKLEFWHLPIKFLEPLGGLGARSDYAAFRKRGIPYTFISSGTPWYYHTQDDSPERLSMEKMAGLTEALLRALEIGTVLNSDHSSWNEFPVLMDRLQAHPELKHQFLDKLKLKEKPSRLDIVRMYALVLPRLKKHKSSLWDGCC